MSIYLGDFLDNATVYIPFTTNAAAGSRVAFSAALEEGDIVILKNGAAMTLEASTITISQDVGGRTGVHTVAVNMGNDADFTIGADYAAVLYPDSETIDSLAPAAVLATWSCENRLLSAAGNAAVAAAGKHVLVSTTIATLASQTSFTITAGSADNDAYNNSIVVVTDTSTSTQKAVGVVSDYVGSTKTVTLVADPGIFTMAVGDSIDILATNEVAMVLLPAYGTAPNRSAANNVINLKWKETHSQSFVCRDADGELINLNSYTSPKLTIELDDHTELQTATPSIGGTGNATFTWTVAAAVTLYYQRSIKWSLRDSSSNYVIIEGAITVEYSPLDD